MLYLSTEIFVPRSPAMVWSILADPGAYLSWVEGLVEVMHESGPAFGVGSVFHVGWKLGRKKILASLEITQLLSPRVLATETRVGSRLALLDRISLEPCPEGTRIEARTEILEGDAVLRLLARPSGLLGAPGAGVAEQRFHERSFEAFRRLVETRTAAPYR